MTTATKKAASLIFPENVLRQHLVVLGKTGAGKSSALRHIVEHLLSLNKRGCVVDPKGDWNGLKVAADGKGPGFPVILFGDFKEVAGKSIPADVPLNEYSGKHIAELVTSGNRPCVVGLRGWTMAAIRQFWVDFASTFFNTNEGEIYLVVDEVHNFAPKGRLKDQEGQAANSLHWTNRLLSEARGLGGVMLIASQRPQKVHNDTLTACETLVAMRVIHKADRDAIEDWIAGNGDKDVSNEVLNSLAGMKRGEAFVWSPEVEFGPERLTFPMFTTYDSFAPPQLQKKIIGKDWGTVDLDEVREKLSVVIEKAKAEDPRELQKKVRELQAEIKKLENAKPAASAKTETKTVEKPVIKDAQLTRLEKLGAQFNALLDRAQDFIAALNDEAATVAGLLSSARQVNAQAVARQDITQPRAMAAAAGTTRVVNRSKPHRETKQASAGGSAVNLPIGEQKILSALIQYPDGLDRRQLTVLAGYKKSSRDAYIARLIQKGFAEVKNGKVIATEDGVAALPDFEPLPTGYELQEYWRQHLPAGEWKILDHLIANYPNAVSREALTEASGYMKSSRDAYIARLAAKELVVTNRGEVTASSTLFAID